MFEIEELIKREGKMKIENVNRFVDTERHQIIWRWEQDGEEMVFTQTLFCTPPREVVKKFFLEMEK